MTPRRFLLACLMTVVGCSPAGPTVAYAGEPPDDLVALVDGVFSTFVDAFPARQSCIGRVVVEGRRDLADRGSYNPESGTVSLRIPATAPQLEISLVHELAHHLEFACADHEAIRPVFMASQGFPAENPWRDSRANWEDSPSEHWASAVVVYVLDRIDERARIVVTDEAVEVVGTWASGGITATAP